MDASLKPDGAKACAGWSLLTAVVAGILHISAIIPNRFCEANISGFVSWVFCLNAALLFWSVTFFIPRYGWNPLPYARAYWRIVWGSMPIPCRPLFALLIAYSIFTISLYPIYNRVDVSFNMYLGVAETCSNGGWVEVPWDTFHEILRWPVRSWSSAYATFALSMALFHIGIYRQTQGRGSIDLPASDWF